MRRSITVDCSRMKISVDMIYSKSMAHRYLIASFLSGRLEDAVEVIEGRGTMPDDIAATAECLRAIGHDGGGLAKLFCRDSGTTARMLMPVAAALGGNTVMKLGAGLRNRPMLVLADAFAEHGASLRQDDDRIYIEGKLGSGSFAVRGDISSQFISGLLFALPMLEGDSDITVTGGMQSSSYIDMTLSVMRRFGVEATVKRGSAGFVVPGAQVYVYPQDADSMLEGDWSSGAMWLAAADLLGQSGDRIGGLDLHSKQGDRKIVDILKLYDAAEGSSEDIEIDASDIPDIVPAIALRAMVYGGTTDIVNAGRLRLKECDRLTAVTEILGGLGADIEEKKDSLIIRGTGGGKLPGSAKTVDTRGDHRMVMMAAMASIVTEQPVRIGHPESVVKSYPDFFEDISKSGGMIWE